MPPAGEVGDQAAGVLVVGKYEAIAGVETHLEVPAVAAYDAQSRPEPGATGEPVVDAHLPDRGTRRQQPLGVIHSPCKRDQEMRTAAVGGATAAVVEC